MRQETVWIIEPAGCAGETSEVKLTVMLSGSLAFVCPLGLPSIALFGEQATPCETGGWWGTFALLCTL